MSEFAEQILNVVPQNTLILSVALEKDAKMPQRAHPSDAGLDVWVTAVEKRGKGLYFCETGLRLAPPQGYYLEVVPRSSIVWRGFILANSVGVIDPSYRGTLKIPLRYLGDDDADLAAQALVGDRVVQLLLRPLIPCSVLTYSPEHLPIAPDDRDQGGFGSTGRT